MIIELKSFFIVIIYIYEVKQKNKVSLVLILKALLVLLSIIIIPKLLVWNVLLFIIVRDIMFFLFPLVTLLIHIDVELGFLLVFLVLIVHIFFFFVVVV